MQLDSSTDAPHPEAPRQADAGPPPAAPPDPPPGDGARPLARDALARRKRRDAAIVLPLAGVVLFASPLLDLVAGAPALFGIPIGVLYLFGTWFGLIALTAALSRRLADDAGEG